MSVMDDLSVTGGLRSTAAKPRMLLSPKHGLARISRLRTHVVRATRLSGSHIVVIISLILEIPMVHTGHQERLGISSSSSLKGHCTNRGRGDFYLSLSIF